MDNLAERIARAWDAVGWKWYDNAKPDHTAKPIFFTDQMRRANAVIQELGLDTTRNETIGQLLTNEWDDEILMAESPVTTNIPTNIPTNRHTNRGNFVLGIIEHEGGRFHGPRVEHLSMEEGAFWRFVDTLIAAARADSQL